MKNQKYLALLLFFPNIKNAHFYAVGSIFGEEREERVSTQTVKEWLQKGTPCISCCENNRYTFTGNEVIGRRNRDGKRVQITNKVSCNLLRN